jgi:branched-chain amino acid aminotransferase group I
MRWIYVNGELIERESAAVSALDRALLYGYGLFETMRSYGGRVFRLRQHHRRLCEGASLLGIAVPLSLHDLADAVEAVLARNELTDAYLRLTLTAGPAPPHATGPQTVALFARPLADYPEELYHRGMAAVVGDVRRNETSPLSRVKSLNYLDNLLAREAARRAGADEAILLNTRGFVAEGGASNVFLLIDGRLLTPSVESGALPGITRQAVLELAAEAALVALETELTRSAFDEASEAFLTNSVMEVMPLTRLNARSIGSGHPGPVTERLRGMYAQLVLGETSAARAG